ncbi:succinate--CoA ligase [GDP-forming] subunit beta, mitochondrial-like [Sycon ciliatum]|uniref:succinate--CoA ligase [GDP-forming] subunit beta, mitochondrial-like n=1 Tax=Sycon ciliatum TaxID=27933 RepID=UPI0020AD34F9|eukprot:scpid82696/ scgid11046/ Succinyl-CoA ligase [GDP-forming] subunit beta, mitochondrial; GTP-specific succinyl-CoA synthetase subunit beta; Succinyl-CoA synthetase beta-G chain
MAARVLGRRLLSGQLQRPQVPAGVSVRCLNLHESDSKQLLHNYDVAVQRFGVAHNAQEAKTVAEDLLSKHGAKQYVVKALVLTGGRGKGMLSSGMKGGVKVVDKVEEVEDVSSKMIGYKLVTKQTGEQGVDVSRVMVAEALDIMRETYFSIILDRGMGGPVMVGSPEGGMDIEWVAEHKPDQIFTLPIDIKEGPSKDKVLELAGNLGFEGELREQACHQMMQLYKLFLEKDATQVEINPLGQSPDRGVVCFDAKINFDDNASYRQKDMYALKDTAEDDPLEVRATDCGLNFIKMDGNIGCLVNGAGLAMATMDIVKLHGGDPANFLDVGGGVQEHQVTEAFNIISSDPKVKSILVNIFGGIVDCRHIANGIISACRQTGLKLPLVVRLAGTKSEEARQLLEESGLAITSAGDIQEAAIKAVASL